MMGSDNGADDGMDDDLNEIVAAEDILRTGETPRDHDFDADRDESVLSTHNRLVIDAFERDDTRKVEVSPDGRTLTVETERFVAKGFLDETSPRLDVRGMEIYRDVEGEPSIFYESDDPGAGEILTERGDARKQYAEWFDAEPAGAAALTVGERNPGLGGSMRL